MRKSVSALREAVSAGVYLPLYCYADVVSRTVRKRRSLTSTAQQYVFALVYAIECLNPCYVCDKINVENP